MYYNPDLCLMYLAHPRTASRATAEALMEQAGFVQPERHGERCVAHHITEEDIVAEVGVDPSKYTTLTTVRNHFDTLVSWYHNLSGPNAFDREWIKWFMRKCSQYLPDPKRLWALHETDVYLRYESLEEDLSAVGLELELPKVGVTQHRGPYRDYYDAPTKAAVEARFGEEMIRLGYGF